MKYIVSQLSLNPMIKEDDEIITFYFNRDDYDENKNVDFKVINQLIEIINIKYKINYPYCYQNIDIDDFESELTRFNLFDISYMFCTDFENLYYIENRVETFSKKERNKNNEKRRQEIEGVGLDEGQD
jgi:hypothetical protein